MTLINGSVTQIERPLTPGPERIPAPYETNRYDWSYDNAYPEFSVWGYDVEVKNKKPGYVCLRDVGWGYFRVFTRQYAPDGPPVEEQVIQIKTPDYYGSNQTYQVLDYSHEEDRVTQYELISSAGGELSSNWMVAATTSQSRKIGKPELPYCFLGT